MVLKLRKVGQAGDTIVEVLLAIAVVSSALGIAYSVMNRNLLIVRGNQERSEASKMALSQIELMKNAAGSSGASMPTTIGGPFCMGASGPVVNGWTGGAGSADVEDDNFSGYPGECQSGFYRMMLRYNSDGAYTVSVRWDSLQGGRSEIVMAYRLQ